MVVSADHLGVLLQLVSLNLVPEIGIEPTTCGASRHRSTTELLLQETTKGIEPLFS